MRPAVTPASSSELALGARGRGGAGGRLSSGEAAGAGCFPFRRSIASRMRGGMSSAGAGAGALPEFARARFASSSRCCCSSLPAACAG